MSDTEHDHPDPFELRLEFHDMLRRLTASNESLVKAARFASTWRAHADVLYAVVLETLESVSPNQRINLFSLCDHILQATMSDGFLGYHARIVADLPRLVAAVCSAESQFGLANVPAVQSILATWKRKKVVSSKLFGEIEGLLDGLRGSASGAASSRTTAPSTAAASALTSPTRAMRSAGQQQQPLQQPHQLSFPPAQHPDWPTTASSAPSAPASVSRPSTANNNTNLSLNSDTVAATDTSSSAGNAGSSTRDSAARQEILRRMEQDRERHKRAREDAWIRAPDEPLVAQFDDAWDAAPTFGPADLEKMSSDATLWQEVCRPPWLFGVTAVAAAAAAAAAAAGGGGRPGQQQGGADPKR
ncbi:hypothetical protein H9P43_000762 [Blastocladiella emersonii ATCC 22665]|nr:hypothetical protein H9P43_000762 [Blastocladiella emersonii ATCC 22665]